MSDANRPAPPTTVPTRVHLVGIGGDGMSSLATVLAGLGHTVTGSDAVDGPAVQRLRARGLAVTAPHGELPETDLVAASTAVPDTNLELVAAHARGLPVLRRAELLGRLTGARPSVGVAGTHGKSTTTGLLAQVLTHAGLDPMVVVGGRIPGLGAGLEHARVGVGPLVFEACEGYGALDHTACAAAFVGNVDDDHVEQYWGGFAELEAGFRRFVAAPRALTIVNGDDARLAAWAATQPAVVSVGLGAGVARRAHVHEVGFDGAAFTLDGERYRTALPGLHNVRNALGAIALARGLDVPAAVVRDALALAVAPRRRLERIGTWNGAILVDDYAHHPTELAAGIVAARGLVGLGGRLVVVFQPTLYSRTRRLAARFAEVLADADLVLLTDIDPREEPAWARYDADPGLIARPLVAARVPAHLCGSIDGALEATRRVLRAGDVLVTMGSGAIGTLGRRLMAQHGLRRKSDAA